MAWYFSQLSQPVVTTLYTVAKKVLTNYVKTFHSLTHLLVTISLLQYRKNSSYWTDFLRSGD